MIGATTMSFGIADAANQGLSSYYLPTLYHNVERAAAVRLDRQGRASRMTLELGALTEDGGLLGSLASGALKMTDRSSTAWASTTYKASLATHWSFEGTMTVSATASNTPEGSLVTAIGPVYATSFALGLARDAIFGEEDAWSIAFSQPLRAESAPVALGLGTGRDWNTGRVKMETEQSSLMPSGREFDLETGYRFPLGDWAGGADVAYSIDSGHVRGENALAGIFWLSRKF